MNRSRLSDGAPRWAIYGSAVLICLFSIVPVLWVLSTAFKPLTEVFTVPPHWIPRRPTFENFRVVLTDPKMLRYFLNTVIISTGSTFLSMIVSVLAAYAFSRYRFPGRRSVLVAIIFSRIRPRVTLIVPFFVILRTLRLYNTYPGLMLVYIMVGMPISLWVIKGFFDNVSREMEESARMDGCTALGILWRIVLPISAPAVGAITMYAFILAWNEFLLALVLTADISTQPIAIGLAFYQTEHGISWGPLMAASFLMSVPAVIVFSVFQGQLVRGLTEGAVKG